MTKFRHSGALGDLIYSLPVIRKLNVTGDFEVVLNNCENVAIKRCGYGPVDALGPHFALHKNSLTLEAYQMLKPLLEAQPYINKVTCLTPEEADATNPNTFINLDDFKLLFDRLVHKNYIEYYFHAFNLPYTPEDSDPWLVVDDPINAGKVVISRSFRYRDPNGKRIHQKISEEHNFKDNAVFVGTPDEYEDYTKRIIKREIPFYQVKDFLELARVIKGAELFIGNQTFTYSLAIGLGQNTILEANKTKTLEQNECYFRHRTTSSYF